MGKVNTLIQYPENPPKPLGEYLIIKEIKPKKTKGGIVMPDGTSNEYLQVSHIVHDLGEIKTDLIKEGDKVVAKSYGSEVMCARQETEEETTDYLLIPANQIIGIYVD